MCTLQFIANKFCSAVNLPASRRQHKQSQQRLHQSPQLIDFWMEESFFYQTTRARLLTESIFGNSGFFFLNECRHLFVKKHQFIHQCTQLSKQASARQELASVTHTARWPRAHPSAAVPVWPLESALEPPLRADPRVRAPHSELGNH